MRSGTLLRWYALKSILKQKIKNNSVVLDIGGYDGFISYKLKNVFTNLDITVVDIDNLGLNIAKKRGLKNLYASALELPIEDNRVDVILCLDLIEHVKEDDKLVKEISRVLKKGGTIILTTPMQNGVSFSFLSKKRMEAINRSWGHVRKGYSLEDIEKLFKNNNLLIEKTSKYFNFFSRFGYWVNSFSGISLKGKSLLYRAIIRLDPYIKYDAKEHTIVGKKVK